MCILLARLCSFEDCLAIYILLPRSHFLKSFKPYSLTWCYHRPYYCTFDLYHAKFQILLMYMVLPQTLLDCISTMQSFKSYSLMRMVLLKTSLVVSPPCKVSNHNRVPCVTACKPYYFVFPPCNFKFYLKPSVTELEISWPGLLL